jgi:hypothetical protein
MPGACVSTRFLPRAGASLTHLLGKDPQALLAEHLQLSRLEGLARAVENCGRLDQETAEAIPVTTAARTAGTSGRCRHFALHQLLVPFEVEPEQRKTLENRVAIHRRTSRGLATASAPRAGFGPHAPTARAATDRPGPIPQPLQLPQPPAGFPATAGFTIRHTLQTAAATTTVMTMSDSTKPVLQITSRPTW